MKKKPTRMCILCRSRLSKNDLLRLQFVKQEIINYSCQARSFYVCDKCMNNSPKILKRVKNMFRQNNITLNFTTNKQGAYA